MSQKAKAVSTARKMKDKWKAKQWYRLLAPEMFNLAMIGESPAETPDHIMGRTVEATVQDLTGDFSKMHIKLRFKVHDIRGLDAHTLFVGHDLTSDYVRRQTRRKRSKTDAVVVVTTKDGWKLKVKPMAVSEQRIQSSQRTAIRHIMEEVVTKVASECAIGEFVKKMVDGDLGKMIADRSKSIVPMKRIEIRKSEVLGFGEIAKTSEEARPEQPSEAQPVEEADVEEGAQESMAEEEKVEESEELTEEELAREASEKKE